jgi:anti-anti-sigma factor
MMENMKKYVIETPSFSGTLLLFESVNLCAILLSGSMDTHVITQMREKLIAVMAGKRYNFVVDLDAVNYISSTGLGFLLYLLKQEREFVCLSNPRAAVIRPFNLFDIKSLFRYYQAIEELENQPAVPNEILSSIREQKDALRAMGPHWRSWPTTWAMRRSCARSYG